MARSSAAQHLHTQVENERLARARAEGVAEGLERALRLVLGQQPSLTAIVPAPAVATPRAAPRARKASTARRTARTAPRPTKRPRRTTSPPATRRARGKRASAPRSSPPPTRGRRRERATAAPLPAAVPEAVPGGLAALFHGSAADALEAALARVLWSPPGSDGEKAASEEVVLRMRPFVVGAARVRLARAKGHVPATESELVQEGLTAVHECCRLRRFRPGRAGAGRTLFPAYALRAARQAMNRLIRSRQVVAITDHGMKLRRRAIRRAKAEARPLSEVLLEEGATPLTVAALERGSVETRPVEQPKGDDEAFSPDLSAVAVEAHAEAEAHLEHLQLGEAAMAALHQLPEAQRVAVAGTLGLSGPATPARTLARRMGCTPEEVEALCAAGLASLRSVLEAQ